MTADGLTVKQRRVLQFITDYWTAEGMSPSLREVASGCGYTTASAVAYHVGILVEAGLLRYSPRIARSLRVVQP